MIMPLHQPEASEEVSQLSNFVAMNLTASFGICRITPRHLLFKNFESKAFKLMFVDVI